MLAPRKKLWTTPAEVINRAIELLDINDIDTVFDIGAGDGAFIVPCCQQTTGTLIGIEIDEERAALASEKIQIEGLTGRCSMLCGNALEQDYSSATAIFLYLIPRGLRLILPLLKQIPREVRVVTYMSPFPESEISPIKVVKVQTTTHPVGEWPLYCYVLNAGVQQQVTPVAPVVPTTVFNVGDMDGNVGSAP